jgi:hypothetical protein
MNSILRFLAAVASLVLAGGALPGQGNYATPYAFTTLAGNAGYGSTDGTGSAARFYYPQGVAVDSAGNAYVADTFNNTIRKITSAGVVTTLAGFAGSNGSSDGTGSAARFGGPNSVALDSTGNVYVADTSNSTIRRGAPLPVLISPIAANGTVGQSFTYKAVFSGSPTATSASGLPPGLSFDPATGIISGTPTAVGSSTITLGATNAAGTTNATFILVVTADSGGPGGGSSATSIPKLPAWGGIALAVALAGLAMRRLRTVASASRH